jgi:hypothetical protein
VVAHDRHRTRTIVDLRVTVRTALTEHPRRVVLDVLRANGADRVRRALTEVRDETRDINAVEEESVTVIADVGVIPKLLREDDVSRSRAFALLSLFC